MDEMNDFSRNTQTTIQQSGDTCTRREKLRVSHVMDARGAVCFLHLPSLTKESILFVSESP